jgi:hypothetical protein
LKKNLLWLRSFDTVEELRQAVLAFKERYNQTWTSSGSATGRRRRPEPSSFNPRPWPHS